MTQKSPSGHNRTTLSGYIFATEACIDTGKNVKQQYLLHMSSQYGELRPTSSWNRFVSLGHPSKFQRLSRLGSVTARARHSSSGRQPNFTALNQGRHLYSAGRPSRWALAHCLVLYNFVRKLANFFPNAQFVLHTRIKRDRFNVILVQTKYSSSMKTRRRSPQYKCIRSALWSSINATNVLNDNALITVAWLVSENRVLMKNETI